MLYEYSLKTRRIRASTTEEFINLLKYNIKKCVGDERMNPPFFLALEPLSRTVPISEPNREGSLVKDCCYPWAKCEADLAKCEAIAGN